MFIIELWFVKRKQLQELQQQPPPIPRAHAHEVSTTHPKAGDMLDKAKLRHMLFFFKWNPQKMITERAGFHILDINN